MRVMIKYWAIILLCMATGLAGCLLETGEGSGGQTLRKRVVTGPTTLAPGAMGSYTITPNENVYEHSWRVEGDGVIYSNSRQRQITVRASQGGSGFKVFCDFKIDVDQVFGEHDKTAMVNAVPLEVTISALPRFRVVLNTPNNLSPATIDGRGAITMTSDNAGANSWSLYFVGDTSGLPKQVPVTITTTNGANLKQLWLDGGAQTQTLLFPRTGGGSVGSGGSVLSTEARPAMIGDGLGETATVTLTANGVQTMVITVKDR